MKTAQFLELIEHIPHAKNIIFDTVGNMIEFRLCNRLIRIREVARNPDELELFFYIGTNSSCCNDTIYTKLMIELDLAEMKIIKPLIKAATEEYDHNQKIMESRAEALLNLLVSKES